MNEKIIAPVLQLCVRESRETDGAMTRYTELVASHCEYLEYWREELDKAEQKIEFAKEMFIFLTEDIARLERKREDAA